MTKKFPSASCHQGKLCLFREEGKWEVERMRPRKTDLGLSFSFPPATVKTGRRPSIPGLSKVLAFCFVPRTPKPFNEAFMGGGASSFFTRLWLFCFKVLSFTGHSYRGACLQGPLTRGPPNLDSLISCRKCHGVGIGAAPLFVHFTSPRDCLQYLVWTLCK